MFDHVFGHNSVKNDFKSAQYLRSNNVGFENSFDRVLAKYMIKHIKNLQTLENFTDWQNQVENNKLTECCLILIST